MTHPKPAIRGGAVRVLMCTAVCIAPLSAPLLAADVTGGTVELGFSAFADDTSVSRGTVRGQLEIGFNRNIGLQLDAGYYGYDTIGDGTNVTLHGLFHGSDKASFGLFLGRDELSGADAMIYGIEGGFELGGAVTAEAHLAGVDDSGASAIMLGVTLANDFGKGLSARVGVEHLSYDSNVDVTNLSLGADYIIGDQAGFYAEVGSLNASAFGLSGSEAYVGLGFKVNFGARRGATFGHRSIFDILPGG